MLFLLGLIMTVISHGYGCNDYNQFVADSMVCGSTYNETMQPLWAQYFSDQDLDSFCNDAGNAAFALNQCGWAAFNADGACNETIEGQLVDHLNLSTADYRQTCTDYCNINDTEARTDAFTCIGALNTTFSTVVAGIDQNSDFTTVCGDLHDAIDVGLACTGAALNNHSCPDAVMTNLTFVFASLTYVYNLTCQNDDFNVTMLLQCGDVNAAYHDLIDCLGPLRLAGTASDRSQNDGLTCLEGARVIDYTTTCVSQVPTAATCPDSVAESINALVPGNSEAYTTECGDYSDYLTTTTTTESSASGMRAMVLFSGTVAVALLGTLVL